MALAGVVAVSVFEGCRQHHPPDPAHDVDIVASDGVVLKASYYSPGRPGPGILLFHQCNMDRHAWDTLTPDLVGAGFHVVSFDLRGFGDTPGSSRSADESKIAGDADAAYAYLISRRDVDRLRVAAGGASCGVMYSSALASRHPEVKALLLLSGLAGANGQAHIAATRSLAVFGAAADGSGSDAADTRQAVAASRHPQSAMRIIRGGGHGVSMFESDGALKGTMVKWLEARFSNNSQPTSPE
jgi:pimeloyl-ACP methyl ester carboxylesterase